jgi:hypothetical protein
VPISLIARLLSPKLSPIRPEYPVTEHRIPTPAESMAMFRESETGTKPMRKVKNKENEDDKALIMQLLVLQPNINTPSIQQRNFVDEKGKRERPVNANISPQTAALCYPHLILVATTKVILPIQSVYLVK